MNVPDCIKINKTNIKEIFEKFKFIEKYINKNKQRDISEDDILMLLDTIKTSKMLIYEVLVNKIMLDEKLSFNNYHYVLNEYNNVYYNSNSFDFFEKLFILNEQDNLNLYKTKKQNKTYMTKCLLKYLKIFVYDGAYTYDSAFMFLEKYFKLIKKYNSKEKNYSNIVKTMKTIKNILIRKARKGVSSYVWSLEDV